MFSFHFRMKSKGEKRTKSPLPCHMSNEIVFLNHCRHHHHHHHYYYYYYYYYHHYYYYYYCCCCCCYYYSWNLTTINS